MNTTDIPVMMTRPEVLRLARISARTLSRAVARGDAPAPVIIGQRARWERSTILAWLRGEWRPAETAAQATA